MTTPYEIPLSPDAQNFSITLNNVDYNFSLQWNEPSAAWKIDIADSNNVNILCGIPLITGVDLLEPYAYLNFGGQLIVQTDHDTDNVPTFDNLGINGHLYWISNV